MMILGNKRFFANQCLTMAVVLYILATFFISNHPVFGYFKAFAEAAIVGGIADWFAVTALFRHPLGLKIPHTAIIPNSKTKIGKNLSQFIRENFLSEDYVKSNLRKFDLHEKGIVLLRSQQSMIVKKINNTLFGYVQNIEYKDIEKFVYPFVKSKIDGFDINLIMIKFFEFVDNKHYHRTAFLTILQQLNKWLENPDNEKMVNEEIKDLIKKDEEGKSTFTGIIKSIFIGKPKLHKYLTDFIYHLEDDSEQKVMKRVDTFMDDIILKIKNDQAVRNSIIEIKNNIIESAPIDKHVEMLFNEIKNWLVNDFQNPESFISQKIATSVDKSLEEIENSKPIKRWVNGQLEGKIPAFIIENAPLIDNYFVEYIEKLDTQQVSKLIEDKVGDDLQFIRINGTLIGGFVGVTLFAITESIKYLSTVI